MDGLVLICNAPKLEGFQLDTAGGGKRRAYWKELIYCGRFQKGSLKFSVTPTTHDPKRNIFSLAHWEQTGRQMLQNGVGVPMPVEHTTDPTKKRADIVEYASRPNSRGVMSLFGKVEFVDADAERDLKSAGVSIYVPTSQPVTDGLGRKYETPITHVAFTDYPVIPGLEKFAIAASFIESDEPDGDKKMSKIMDYASQLGLPTDGKDDDSIVDDIAAFVSQMKNDLTALQDALDDGSGGDKGKTDPDDASSRGQGATDDADKPKTPPDGSDSAVKSDDEKKKDEAVQASLVKVEKRSRALQLGQLRETGRITPAQHKQLTDEYCSDGALSLAFGREGVKNQEGFERLVGILAANKPQVEFGGKTGIQSSSDAGPLQLSKPYGDDSNGDCLVKNAEARAAGKR